MSTMIELGLADGRPYQLNLHQLVPSRLLVQGNSGSGKSHLLRRLLEQTAASIQQIVIDPEGDYVTLADQFPHVVIKAVEHGERALGGLGDRARQHRVSVVLDLEGAVPDQQMRLAAAFLGGIFNADRSFWFPALVVVDEAQLFAPAAAGEVSEDARKASMAAMVDLMCRGRKRGLCGILATQRLAKLAKNAAAECSNFLFGRTFLDIDMARAAELIGVERRQAEVFRDLESGYFVGLGPALSRRPVTVRIGPVLTRHRGGTPELMPLPDFGEGDDARSLLMTPAAAPAARLAPAPLPRPVRDITAAAAPAPLLVMDADDEATVPAGDGDGWDDAPPLRPELPEEPAGPRPRREEIVADLLAEGGRDKPLPALFNEFLLRAHRSGLTHLPDLATFRLLLEAVKAGATLGGVDDPPGWDEALAIAQALPRDMQSAFLFVARRAALGQAPPTDEEVAHAMQSASVGRGRRMLGYLVQQGAIELDDELGRPRAIRIPALGWSTRADGYGSAA
jgi:hypothetical protein